MPIINRVGFLAIGNGENWVNKPTVSFKSLARESVTENFKLKAEPLSGGYVLSPS